MTREQQRLIRETKQVAKITARLAVKEDRQELKSWNKMIAKAKAKGAWIE